MIDILDSPLLKAVKEGHILIIDEADKADCEVVTVLKNLVYLERCKINTNLCDFFGDIRFQIFKFFLYL